MTDFTNEAIRVTRRLVEIEERLANGDVGDRAREELVDEREMLEEKDKYLSVIFDLHLKYNEAIKVNEQLIAGQKDLIRTTIIKFVSDTTETGQFGWSDCCWFDDWQHIWLEQQERKKNQ